jgi:hypothetical protein
MEAMHRALAEVGLSLIRRINGRTSSFGVQAQ